MTVDLDYAPLSSRASMRHRLRAVAASTIWVYSMTIGVLLVLVPALVLVGVLTLAESTDAGAVVLSAMIVAAGLYVIAMVLHQVGGDAALAALARANELELTQSSAAPHYAGRRFGGGGLLVHRSVRTRGAAFLEVGETYPLGTPRGSDGTRPTDVFLRVGLAGPVSATLTAVDLVDTELDAGLTRWAGRYELECADHELTLHGSRSLDPRSPDRVRDGFELAERLRRRADEHVVGAADDDAALRPTLSGIPVPALPRRPAPSGRRRGPLVVVAATVGFLVVGPLVIALVMSALENSLRGRSWLVSPVVGLLVLGAVTAAGALVRFLTSAGRGRDVQEKR